ncbi:MAG TPA: matrixin family metalloprotease [Chloroflexota bacterium]|nr:matrixin family metalloprotease [Chloroflexota bacterium]
MLLLPQGPAAAHRLAGAAARPPEQDGAQRVRWPDSSLPVPVDLSALPAEWQEPARAALAAWNSAGTPFWYVEAPADRVPLNAVRFEVVDRLYTCGGQWQPAACTFPFVYQRAPGYLSHVVIQLVRERLQPPPSRRLLDTVDLPALLTHELGHALGLGEAASPTAAMFPGALWHTLGADDIRELQALYGTAEGARPERAPSLLTPADGAVVLPRPVLRWEALPDAFEYYLQVAPASAYTARGGLVDLSFGEYVLDTLTADATYAFAAPLAAGTEYYWRVKARTPGGNSPWSPPARFTVGEARP